AAARNRLIVPHCWKTGISISATAHLAFVTPHCPFIEFLPPELSEDILRRELVAQELTMSHGEITLPQAPGLGIELNWDAMRRFAA
ncbi:MAG TPA: enolase C-terminal domain-like protein, partial [Hyphomicrobiaceae bacterium]|nr:enolase C-terminal domain-like protein [Hyphomicrobiaceae bacterium]